jgi:hypothetical protein
MSFCPNSYSVDGKLSVLSSLKLFEFDHFVYFYWEFMVKIVFDCHPLI